MADEVIRGLNIKPDGVYADGTLGGAGHASLIAEGLNESGRLYGIDKDAAALETSSRRLEAFGSRCVLIRGSFTEMKQLINEKLDGALLDLGVSSHQLDTPERGFSYRYDAPLDMRMDDRAALTAYEVVNSYDEAKLTEIFFKYGEERFSKRIAKAVVNARPVETTGQLATVIVNAVPAFSAGGHPAKKVFQAVRIEVNGELAGLEQALRDIADILKPGGRFCVITFHSLEDRVVKQTFANIANPCDCPRDIPYCVCGKKPSLKLITRKPLLPGSGELANNPRSHSAKLRVAEKV
jgi:16S rRNA (cytosine1402-N4)-methyltransferase